MFYFNNGFGHWFYDLVCDFLDGLSYISNWFRRSRLCNSIPPIFMSESSTQDTEEVKIPIPVFPSSDSSDDDDWVFYADL